MRAIRYNTYRNSLYHLKVYYAHAYDKDFSILINTTANHIWEKVNRSSAKAFVSARRFDIFKFVV